MSELFSWMLLAIFVVVVLLGVIASLVGFGIGSLLTPLFAISFGMPIAVAAVALSRRWQRHLFNSRVVSSTCQVRQSPLAYHSTD